MSDADSQIRGQSADVPTLVWLDEPQLELARSIADLARLRFVRAGSSSRAGSQTIAASLDADPFDDLRAAIASASAEEGDPIELVLLLSPGPFGSEGIDADAQAVQAARSRGVRVISIEPVPASALVLAAGSWTRARHGTTPLEAIHTVPLIRRSAVFRDATEVLQDFGGVRTLAVEAMCAAHEGSLGARLYSAMELIYDLMGEPELIDAAYAWPGAASSLHMLPGDSLRELHGDLTANIRFADGRIASIVASDRAGRWSRRATLINASGRLTLGESSWVLVRSDGTEDRGRDLGSEAPLAAAAIADAVSRRLDPATPDDPPTDAPVVLAMCQAALLSARTGQGESPETIRRMSSIA